jgi:hypothetical protein
VSDASTVDFTPNEPNGLLQEVTRATSIDHIIPILARGGRSKQLFLFIVCVSLFLVSGFISTQEGSPSSLKSFVDDVLGAKDISLGFSGDHAQIYSRCGSLLLKLSGEDLTSLTSVRQMRELLPIKEDDLVRAWRLVLDHKRLEKKGSISSVFIRGVLDQYSGIRRVQRASSNLYTRLLFSMENDRYGTPQFIIDCVRLVFGGVIDLDPFSESTFNLVVKAVKFYTREANGLDRRWSPWWGNCFLNPPGGKTPGGESISGLALKRAIFEWKHMTMLSAIVLIKAAIGYDWFNQVWEFPRCWLSVRPSFTNPENSENGQAPMGYVAVYMGKEPQRFKEVFSKIGHVDGVP